jgi:hypothetical protein
MVIDGAWLVGTDLDTVGFEWGEAVEQAVALQSGRPPACGCCTRRTAAAP